MLAFLLKVVRCNCKYCRERDLDAYKEENRIYEERLENMRQQLMGERNKNLKKTNKEVAEVRKTNKETVEHNLAN